MTEVKKWRVIVDSLGEDDEVLESKSCISTLGLNKDLLEEIAWAMSEEPKWTSFSLLLLLEGLKATGCFACDDDDVRKELEGINKCLELIGQFKKEIETGVAVGRD